jgi:hypothetical protein
MSDETKPSSIVTEALDCFAAWASVEDKQRKREIEDLQFQVPELQWPAEVAITRKAQQVEGVVLAARPMLSIPKLDQPIQLVLNSEKAAHLGVQVHPLTEESDEDTAEALQGLYRAIEVDSRANLARSWAFERAVKAGRGFYRILKEYDEDSDHPSDQKIVLKRIYEQGSVYLDPSCTEPDGSDAERALIVEDIPIKRYRGSIPTPSSPATPMKSSSRSAMSGRDGSRAKRKAWRFGSPSTSTSATRKNRCPGTGRRQEAVAREGKARCPLVQAERRRRTRIDHLGRPIHPDHQGRGPRVDPVR